MTALHDAAYKGQINCYELLSISVACDVNQKEGLKYKAEQLLHQTTGTNVNGPMSYGGSTLAAASIAEGRGRDGGEGGFDLNSEEGDGDGGEEEQ
jgi:ABC-type sulfate transport system substrate-binding protein